MKKKTLYILMENQVREINSLILISIISAFRGYRVYVGSHYSILKLLEAKKDFGDETYHLRMRRHRK